MDNSVKRTAKLLIRSAYEKALSPIAAKKLRVLAFNIQNIKNITRGTYQFNVDNLFDYKDNIKPRYKLFHSYYYANTFYDLEGVLNKFTNHKKPIRAAIEHGMYWGISGEECECVNSGLPAVITYSDFREKRIREISDIDVIKVGPLIHYAEGLSSENVRRLKKELGKTLLVMLTHSVEQITMNYDVDEFINKIEEYKMLYGFESVLVCLYYSDVELGRAPLYERAGYTVVASGSKQDMFFLSRLKSFMQISDHLLTNSISTHIGYAVYLNLPVSYFEQKIDVEASQKELDFRWRSFKMQRRIDDEQMIKEHFLTYREHLTEDQIDICKYVWGFDYIKNPNQLLEVLNNLDNQ